MKRVQKSFILPMIALMLMMIPWMIDYGHAGTNQTPTFSASGNVWAQGGGAIPRLSESIELDLNGGFTAGSIGDYGALGSYGAEVSAETTGTVGVGLNATFNDPGYSIDNPYSVNFTHPDLESTPAGEGFALGMATEATNTTLNTTYLSPSFGSTFYINDLGATVSGKVCFYECASGEQSLLDAVNVDQPLLWFDNPGGETAPTLEAFGGATIRSFPAEEYLTYADLTIHAPNVTRSGSASGHVTVNSDIDLFDFQANISNMLMTATGIPLNQSTRFLDYIDINYTTLQGRIGPKLALGTDSTFTAGELTTRLEFDKPIGVWDDAAHTSYSVITSLTLADGDTIPDLFVLRPGETITVTPTYMASDGHFTNTLTANLSLLADLKLLDASLYMAGPDVLGVPDPLVDISAGPAFEAVKDNLLKKIHLATSEFDITFLSQTGSAFDLTAAAGSCQEAGSVDSGFIFDPLCQGTLSKTGAGTLELFADNTYAGGTVLAGGTVMVEKDANLGDASGALTFDGGALMTRNFDDDPTGIVSARSVTLEEGGGTFDSNGLDSKISGVISGEGSFVKASAGTLTLAGVNTYTGATTVDGGTLALSGAGSLSEVTAMNIAGGTAFDIVAANGDRAVGSLNGSGGVYLGANTLATGGNDADAEFGGEISGSGGIAKVGGGTQVFSGTNTYTGTTALEEGILSVSSDANLGSGGGIVFDGGTLLTTDSFASGRAISASAGGGTFDTGSFDSDLFGVISGEGSFGKDGAGNLTLYRANTYTGATGVANGTLLMAGGGSLSGVTALDVADGAAFDITAADGDRAVGSLAGEGTVQIGANGLSAGHNNADTTFSGVISGSGSVLKAGTGNWTLEGANTYSGGTVVSAGTLAGNATSLQGDIRNDAAVVFDQTLAGTYAGNMHGSGTLTKQNAGILNLTGVLAHTGDTIVETGGLRVNGSLLADVLVGVEGLLGGAGTIGGTVTNQGTLAPGNSIDTIVVGDYVSAVGSTHEVEVTASGESDLIAATGTATLEGGSVEVLTDPTETSADYRRRTLYDIVTAQGGVSGTYERVDVDMAELNPLLHYGDPSLVELILVRNDIDFAQIAGARTGNQRSVGRVLTQASPEAFLLDMADVLDLYVDGLITEEERRAALDEMGGQRLHTSIPVASISLVESFQGAVGRRMNELHRGNGGAVAQLASLDGVMLDMAGDVTDIGPTSRQKELNNNLWFYLHGVDGDVDGDENAAGYDYNTFGFAAGIDYQVGSKTHVGLTGGYATSDVATSRGDEADVDSLQIGLYGNYEKDALYVDGMVSYVNNDYGTVRRIGFGTLARTAEGDYDGYAWTAATEIGFLQPAGGFNIRPFFGSRYIHLEEESFTEEGADALNLNVEARSTTSWKIIPGLNVNRPFTIGEEMYLVPEVFAKWLYEVADDRDVVDASFVGAPEAGSFRVEGIEMDRQSIELGGGFRLAGELTEFSLNYVAKLGDKETSHSLSGGLVMHW